jgi:predicted dehydrogenase
MVQQLAPDIVHVCSPHHWHAQHSITALAGGAHVVCEKPMATSIEDGLRIIEAVDRASRIGAVAYMYRGYPLVEVLRAKVAAGAFGTLRRVGGCYLSQEVFAADNWNQQEPNIWIERSASGNTVYQRAPEALPPGVAWMSALPAGHAEGYVDAFRNIIFQAWNAMRGAPIGYPRFADGLRGLKIIDAAVSSAALRRTVTVDA